MNINRGLKHLWSHSSKLNQYFSKSDLAEITRAIGDSENQHSGQICFAVEGALDWSALLNDLTPRDRAVEVFSNLRIWDTEQNNGVLIYLLLADKAVEIVSDRGIHAKVNATTWDAICQEIESHFATKQYKNAVLSGITSISQLLQEHFPKDLSLQNEIANEPVLLGTK